MKLIYTVTALALVGCIQSPIAGDAPLDVGSGDGSMPDMSAGADASTADASSDMPEAGEGCNPICSGTFVCVDGRCDCPPDGDCVCGDSAAAPGAAVCPDACTGGCSSNVCNINCGPGECDSAMLECPLDYDCEILCDGVDACDTATILCPAEYRCAIECRGGGDACGDIAVQCGAGSCAITCAGDACSGAELTCGVGPCTAECDGAPAPVLGNADAACAVVECE